MKKWLLVLTPIASLMLILGVSLHLVKPKLERWALENLESFSRSQLPVIVTAEELRLSFLLPQAEFRNLKIEAKDELELQNLKLDIDRATAKLDVLQLLTGRVQLSALIIEGLGTDVNLDPFLKSDNTPKPIDWGPFFRTLRKVPVSRLALQSASAHLFSPKLKLEVDLIELDALILNESERLQVRLDLQDSDLTWGELASPVRLQADASLSPQGLDITDLRVLGLGSLVRGSASFTNLPYLFLSPEGTVQVEVKAALPQVSQLLKKIKSAPPLAGTIEAKGQIEMAQGSIVSGGFRMFGAGLKVDKFNLGQFETEGRLFNDVVQIEKIQLTHDAGLAEVENIEVKLTRENDAIQGADLKADLSSEALDLHELLLRLGIGDLPLEAFLSTRAKCTGPLWPDLAITCEGDATGEEIEVRSGEGLKKTIVQIEEIRASGRVQLDLEKVTYEVQLKAGQDSGRSSGLVRYATGFEIDFSTPRLHFSNVQHLVGLNIEGSARINGKTTGNSDAARFQMQLDGNDISFEKFYLGQVRTGLRYDEGHLLFENLLGTVGSSTYAGFLDIDLRNEQMRIAAKSDRLDLFDVAQVLEKRIKIPIIISGSGVAEIDLQGPLEINRLTYKATAHFSKVAAAGESFDQVHVEAVSTQGEFAFQNTYVSKGEHRVLMSGVGHPNGQIQFLVQGSELPLEQSENIALLGSNISGLLAFSLQIGGELTRPQLLLKADVTNIIVEEQELPTTQTEMKINEDYIEGSASLVGGKLTSKFKFPLTEGEDFRLQLKAQDWNFTTLFTLIGAGPLLSEYQSSLTGTLDLQAERGGPWASSGRGEIQRVLLKRGGLSLENPKPIITDVRSGTFSFENFLLQGPDARIAVTSENSTRDQLNMSLKSETELRLFQIFLPFLDELSGRARASMTIAGSIFKPEILGSARTESAFLKIKDFPHPFEKIDADVQFSQSRILINGGKGELAGGTFTAGGSVEIVGPRDLPTQIQAQVRDVTLNVPDNVRTSGSGELNFTGNWFPFTLSGVYRVRSGLIDKEFTDEATQNQIKQSSYLPKIILQRAFEPIVLDLQIVMNQPVQIKNSMIDGSLTGQIQVKGPPGSPLLFGAVSTEKNTKLLLRDKVFEVNTANVRFNDPNEINPELYVTARTRVNEYDINLLVQGTAKNPIIRNSSTPPLSEQDIVSLLALGVTSADVDKRLQRKDQDQSGQYQVGTALLQQFEPVKKLQKAAGIDVQYSSSYDSVRNIEVRKFTVTKQLSPKTKISVGFPPDKQPDELRLEYLLTPNLSAVGSVEQEYNRVDPANQQNQQNSSDFNVLGLDLEFRKEFR